MVESPRPQPLAVMQSVRLHLVPLARRVARLRGLRFLLTGGLCAVVQFALFAAFVRYADPLLANPIAFLCSAQLNFLLSQSFTWRDRAPASRDASTMLRRWLTFHASIATGFLINMTVFALTQLVIPPLPAVALGVAAASGINFLMNDRWTFGTGAPAARP